MGNPTMQEELTANMQALLYDPIMMAEEEGAERPPCGTPHVPLSRHAHEGEDIDMHEGLPHHNILDEAPFSLLPQEKEGSDTPMTSDSDAAPRRRRAQPSPSQVKKRPPLDVPKFSRIKKGKRSVRMRKRRKEPSSPSSSPSSWGKSLDSSSSSEDEDYYPPPKRMHGERKGRKAYNAKGRS